MTTGVTVGGVPGAAGTNAVASIGVVVASVEADSAALPDTASAVADGATLDAPVGVVWEMVGAGRLDAPMTTASLLVRAIG